MAVYRTIQTCFWEDDKIQDDMNLEERFFYLYLLTNTRTKQCGCYSLIFKKVKDETTLSKEKVLKLLKKFEEVFKLIKFDKETKEVLLLNFDKYNWTKSPKVKKCIEKEMCEIKNIEFKKIIQNKVQKTYGIDTLSIQYGEKEVKSNKKEKEIISTNSVCKHSSTTISEAEEKVLTHPDTTHTDFSFSSIYAYGVEMGISEEYCRKFYDYYRDVGWVTSKGEPITRIKPLLKKWYNEDMEKEKKKKKKMTKEELENEAREIFGDI